jgi:hypothetical protein
MLPRKKMKQVTVCREYGHWPETLSRACEK